MAAATEMTKNVEEQGEADPRPSSLVRSLTDGPNARQDVENHGGGAATTTITTAVDAVAKKADDDPDIDPGIGHGVETQMSVLTFFKIVSTGQD